MHRYKAVGSYTYTFSPVFEMNHGNKSKISDIPQVYN